MNIDFNLVLIVSIPCIIIALVAFFSMKSLLRNELLKQKYELLKTNQKQGIPVKMQAFERLTLLLDRISLQKLLVRVSPIGEDIKAYKHLLVSTIAQEFEHNVTQQIYVSDECWAAIESAKSTLISQLHSLNADGKLTKASEYRELGLVKFTSNDPTSIAQTFIRSEVSELF